MTSNSDDKPNDDLEQELDSIASEYIIQSTDIKLYHYTSLSALKSIIDNNKIWASNSFFLNDAKEIIHLEEFLIGSLKSIVDSPSVKITKKEEFEKMIRVIYEWAIDHYKSRLFVLSLTDKSDSLPLWLYYGANDGYNLEIVVSDLLRLSSGRKKTDNEMIRAAGITENVAVHVGIFFGRVIYDDDQKKEIMKKYLNLLVREISSLINNSNIDVSMTTRMGRVAFALANFAYLAKHSSFAPESEYRVLYAGRDEQSVNIIKKFRIRNGVLMPFTEITFNNDRGESPIKAIKIGPKKNMELAKIGLKEYLSHKRLFETQVTVSALPLRD